MRRSIGLAGRVWRWTASEVLITAALLLAVAACVSCAPLTTAGQSVEDGRGYLAWLGADPIERRQRLSDLAGTASFVVWLFAQSPQLYENYKNSSCDGLSFVFLAQWMAGDATNLIGSVLTGQLPFQIAIATYFCCIDAGILLQYYYYWHRDRRLAQRQGRLQTYANGMLPHTQVSRTSSAARTPLYTPHGTTRDMMMSDSISSLASSQHSLLAARRRQYLEGGQAARDPSASTGISKQSRAQSRDAISGRSGRSASKRPLLHTPQHSYRALEQAAMSVAELAHEAEVTAARREARRRRMQESLLHRVRSGAKSKERQAAQHEAHSTDCTDEEDDHVPQHMLESVASLSSRRSSSEEAGFPFGITSVPNLRFTNIVKDKASATPPLSPSQSIGDRRRGRDMSRTVDSIRNVPGEGADKDVYAQASAQRPMVSHSTTRSSRRGTSLARRNTGLVFLGIAALFTFGQDAPSSQLQMSRHLTPSSDVLRSGHVIGSSKLGFGTHDQHRANDEHATYVQFVDNAHKEPHDGHPPPPEYPHAPPTWDMLVGRISAWTCALLYITSRMPQIWTNMQRRSVQGLSILLFIAAATGNLLYTISVLANPKASVPPSTPQQRSAFLLESLPFLLGSGGTLIFDAIIVAQWLAWRGKEPDVDYYFGNEQDEYGTHYPSAQPMSQSSTHEGQAVAHRSASRPRGLPRWHSQERQPLLNAESTTHREQE